MRSRAEKHENENTQKECLPFYFFGKKKVKMKKKENQERNYEEKV